MAGPDSDAWRDDRMVGVFNRTRTRRTIPAGVAPEQVIAEWMLAIFRKTGGLTQKQALWGIRELFGEVFLGRSPGGRPTIPRPVLKAFQELDPEGIVWSVRRRAWRPRQPEDPPGRRHVPD